MNSQEIINRLWDIYDDLGRRFGYLELYDLREVIEILEDEL